MGEEQRRITQRDVLAVLDVNEEFLIDLERESIIDRGADGSYAEGDLERIRLCRTLHDELGVNLPGIDVALHLIETIDRDRARFWEVLSRIREALSGPNA
jgi:MerR-like DNA binding protein